MTGERLLPVAVVAKRLCCSASLVYRLIACGELVCIRTGPRKGYMVAEKELQDFLERRRIDDAA